jgi:hypothetical protein
MGIRPKLERYQVAALGRSYQCQGQIEPVGQVLNYFNTGNRRTFPLYDVTLHPITPKRQLTIVSRPEVILNESELGLLVFLDPEDRGQIDLLRQFDRVIVYTPHVVVRGNFHRGAETKLGDLLDLTQGRFLAMTDVSIFPTSQLPAPFPQQTDILIINRSHVQLYHPE